MSLFDQYESAATRGPAGARPAQQAVPEPIQTGFINTRVEDDTPIFNKQRINFSPPDPISHLAVGNNFLVLAMSSNILLRIDLEHPEEKIEVEIPKSVDDRIYNMLMDPTGRHLLISMKSGENFYLPRTAKRPKALTKLKGHNISAIAWNMQNTSDTSTGEILVGTAKGLIIETEIGEDARFFQSSLEHYVKQLFDLGNDKSMKVTGLEFEKMPSTSLTEYRYFVMATTPGRLYQFVGAIPTSTEPPMFSHIFSQYEDVPERFLELPGNFGYSVLKFFHPKFRGLPRTFAWMTGPGIYFGRVDVTGAAGNDAVTMETKLIRYPGDEAEKRTPPLALVLTEFHALLLYKDKVKAMCILNDQLVFEDVFSDRFGQMLGVCKDPIKGTLWAYSDKAVFKYKIIRETRDVWQMYLDKSHFELAKQYCKDNQAHMDRVLTKQAEHLFSLAKYEDSAATYAQTQNSFEEVVLKFIQLEQKDALKIFLMRKMGTLKPQDKTQLTLLMSWLVELNLNQLGQLREQSRDVSPAYDALQEDFRKLLASPKVRDCVSENRSLVYELIASHGDVEDMVFFAVLMKDFERVITHHLQNDNYRDSLAVLAKQGDMELFYRFSPVLMQSIPRETVDAWISQKGALDPCKLIPALVQYDHTRNAAQCNEAIRYLEFCIQALDVRDEAIHNYLLSLYARLQPDNLMKYLNLQGQDPDQVSYDVKYALRLCCERDLQRACVHIYSVMGLYEEAVDLALQVDVDLAKQNADRPDDDEELRRKLWLKIARHVVEEEEDIKRAMEFLHECDLLKIEDILPFFPDFVTIDHFKDAICTSLQEYNQHIEVLKTEMEEATENAQDIRTEIQGFRNKFTHVKSQDKCVSCGFPLMTRTFYVFPCMHRYHSDCLVDEVLPHLTSGKRGRVEDLQRGLAAQGSGTSPRTSPAHLPSRSDAIKEELDDLVAGECVLCGDIMIRTINKPFIDDEEYDAVIESWK